jgi:hypothetical protein
VTLVSPRNSSPGNRLDDSGLVGAISQLDFLALIVGILVRSQ